MGNFIITTPTIVGTKTVQQSADAGNSGVTDADLINGVIGDGIAHLLATGAVLAPNTAVSGVIRFGFGLSNAIISLDGNAPISFFGLPSGFTLTSAIISIIALSDGNPAFQEDLYLQLDSLTESSVFHLDLNGLPLACNFAYSFNPPFSPTMLDIMSNGFGFRCTFANNQRQILLYSYSFTGTYEIQQFKFVLQNPTVPVRVGDKVKITSSTGGLDGVKQIILSYTDPVTKILRTISLNIDNQNPSITVDNITIYGLNFIVIQDPFNLWFYLPWNLGPKAKTVKIVVVGNGTQFSGSVTLGTLQILNEDASGIYSLIKGQTNDILYFRDGYITDTKLIMLPNISEDEILFEDDFFSLLTYPRRILSDSDSESNDEVSDFSIISTLRIPVVTETVEIPSPFAKTAFIP